MANSVGGRIAAVAPGSSTDRAGVRPGMKLLSLDGHPVRDLIDYRFYADGGPVTLEVEEGGTRHEFRVDGELGLGFAKPLFDGVRRCRNQCPFCFLRGLPRGLRPGLYLKDDDYRLSFLFGNFITLTNLAEADWRRLAEQRLSPLYVSVHTTNPDLRRRLMGHSQAGAIMEQLRRLGQLNLRAHTQVVLIPGVNDGPELDRTVHELAELFPTVLSIAVVPVGLSAHFRPRPGGPPLSSLAPEGARALLRQVRRWRADFRRRLGVSLVYPSDEVYLRAGAPFPAAATYDGFPQYENGVGMVRHLLNQAAGLRRRLQQHPPPTPQGPVAVVCGTLIAPVLARIVEELSPLAKRRLTLYPVENRFFGSQVSASGLLTGSDLVTGLRGKVSEETVVVHSSMVNDDGRFLDGLSRQEVARTLGTPLRVVSSLGELIGIDGNRVPHTLGAFPGAVSSPGELIFGGSSSSRLEARRETCVA